MITTNLTSGEWASVFGEAEMTTALLDRLTLPAIALDQCRLDLFS